MPPKGPEYRLQSQIAELAHMLGWETIAFRPLFTKAGFRTPGSGSMAKGWPDMTLVRAKDRRLIFAELKSDVGKTSPDQDRVLEVLRSLEGLWRDPVLLPTSAYSSMQVQVFVWRPEDFDRIQAVLR
jgi:hypothetical protein